MKKIGIVALGCGVVLTVCGCANWGATEPVLGGGGYGADSGLVVSQPVQAAPAAERTFAPVDDSRQKRELAALKADLDALREEQKILMSRIIGLEGDNSKKELQLKELQALLDAMDKRFADVDSGWRTRMAELGASLDRERQARQNELKRFTEQVNKNVAAKQQAGDNVSYTVITVKKGDTLSAIASALKISIADIKKLNNMKSDIIYENQKLKVPAVQ